MRFGVLVNLGFLLGLGDVIGLEVVIEVGFCPNLDKLLLWALNGLG